MITQPTSNTKNTILAYDIKKSLLAYQVPKISILTTMIIRTGGEGVPESDNGMLS